MRHPYTQALFRSIPLPGADKNARPLIAIPGNFPLPHERPAGCNFGPRCAYFVEGRCNATDIPMVALPGADRHESRCLRIDEIDWAAPPTAGKVQARAEPGRVVLKFDELKKYYSVGTSAFGGGTRKVVKANETLSFEAREGETLAIVGASGSGKSTLLHLLGGLDAPTSGTVHLMGRSLTALNPAEQGARRNQHLGFVYQFHHLLPEFTAQENVAMPLWIRRMPRAQALERAAHWLARVGLAERLQHLTETLNAGIALKRRIIEDLRPSSLANLGLEPALEPPEMYSGFWKHWRHTDWCVVPKNPTSS